MCVYIRIEGIEVESSKVSVGEFCSPMSMATMKNNNMMNRQKTANLMDYFAVRVTGYDDKPGIRVQST